MSDHTNEETGVTQSENNSARRDFLKKAGKFALYTPPAVMMLMKPSYATFSNSTNGRPPERQDFKKSFKSSFKSSFKPSFKRSKLSKKDKD